MAVLSIGRETFEVEVAGDPTRPVVILSNALGTDLTMWDGQIEALTPHFRVVRYDTRGHGGSSGGREPTSIAELGRDALAILDALEIETVHWLGLSMGGSIGLWLLTHAPERIDRAVLANTAPQIGTADSWNTRITHVLADGMDEIAAGTMTRWFSPDFAARAPHRVAAIDTVFRKTSPQAYAACCAALRDMDLRHAIRSIDHEVLVISGRADPTVPADLVAAFLTAMPVARHVALDARHLSNIEAEAAFNAAVVAFLTTKATAAKAPRKAAPTKTRPPKAAAVKRARASLRSNAARSPLKKVPAKRMAAKKGARRKVAAAKKAGASRRRSAAKAAVVRRSVPKVTAKRPSRAPRKTANARRPTPTTTARIGAKAAVKKPKAKSPTKPPAKKAGIKGAAKRLPATRRKPTTKPRRPKGRRP